MPPIPKYLKETKTKINPSKNFLKENKNKIKNSLPNNPRQYIVSDRKGNKYLINGSGLEKDFIYKKVIYNKNLSKIILFFRLFKRIMVKFHRIFKHINYQINH